MVYELLIHIFSLDFPWLSSFLANNIFWIFAIFAVEHFWTEGKKAFRGFVCVSFMLLAVSDFLRVTNLVIWTAEGILVLYLGRFVLLIIVENTKSLKKHLSLFFTLAFYAILLFYNLFLVN